MEQANKENEEIALLLLQQKDMRSRLLLDWPKVIGIFIGAGIAFWIIQAPDAEHKRKAELTKLYFQTITIEDSRVRALALGHLRKELGLSKEESILPLATSAECSAVRSADYIKLFSEIENIEKELQAEATGIGGSGKPGLGPRYRAIQLELQSLKSKADQMKEQLQFCGEKIG